MKSAFELAMERSGGEIKELSSELKEKLSDIDSLYKAKRAEAELSCKKRLVDAAGDPEARKRIEEDIVVELAGLRSKCEQEKEKIRNGK